MNFACELMDLCRGTQEVEAVLSEGGDKEGIRDPLARLKMAMEYEEKKVRKATATFPCQVARDVFLFIQSVSYVCAGKWEGR